MNINDKFPICFSCKYYDKSRKCKAFKEIPKEIFVGDNNHSKPLKDQDNDIVFEEIEGNGK